MLKGGRYSVDQYSGRSCYSREQKHAWISGEVNKPARRARPYFPPILSPSPAATLRLARKKKQIRVQHGSHCIPVQPSIGLNHDILVRHR